MSRLEMVSRPIWIKTEIKTRLQGPRPRPRPRHDVARPRPRPRLQVARPRPRP